jgi:hypothetical protein
MGMAQHFAHLENPEEELKAALDTGSGSLTSAILRVLCVLCGERSCLRGIVFPLALPALEFDA